MLGLFYLLNCSYPFNQAFLNSFWDAVASGFPTMFWPSYKKVWWLY